MSLSLNIHETIFIVSNDFSQLCYIKESYAMITLLMFRSETDIPIDNSIMLSVINKMENRS